MLTTGRRSFQQDVGDQQWLRLPCRDPWPSDQEDREAPGDSSFPSCGRTVPTVSAGGRYLPAGSQGPWVLGTRWRACRGLWAHAAPLCEGNGAEPGAWVISELVAGAEGWGPGPQNPLPRGGEAPRGSAGWPRALEQAAVPSLPVPACACPSHLWVRAPWTLLAVPVPTFVPAATM